MNSDLISRSELKKHKFTTQAANGVEIYRIEVVPVCAIDNAPTVERSEGEWIPVSARLPKVEDYRPCYGLPDGCIMWQTDNGVIGFGWYYYTTKCWSDIYDHPITTGKVIAWQPLPEPYKKGVMKNE